MSDRKSVKSAPERREPPVPRNAPRERTAPGRTPGAPARSDVVAPTDEKGVPYRGDFPNPLGVKNRGCF